MRARCLPSLAFWPVQRNILGIDDLDRAIVSLLQQDGRLTNQELAARVGLTPAPCLRRVRRLEADGVITGYTARVDHRPSDAASR